MARQAGEAAAQQLQSQVRSIPLRAKLKVREWGQRGAEEAPE